MAARRPKPFSVGPVKVRVVRGPHGDDAERWYWQALRYEDSAQRCVWSGWATAADALRAVSDLVAAGQHDAPPAPPQEPGPEIKTVRDLLRYYGGAQKARADLSPATKKNVANSAAHVWDVIGDVLLDRVTPETLAEYRDRALREGRSTGSVVLDFQVLRAGWRWGEERNVCTGRLRPPAVKHKPARDKFTPTLAQVDAAIAHARLPWVRDFLTLCRYTGARLGEVCGLRWADVHLDTGELTIRTGQGAKTGARVVAIPPDLVAYLAATPEAARVGRVLPTSALHAHSNAAACVRDVCRQAGVPEFTSHGIRRAVIDAYYESGADVGAVAAQLGQSPEVALRYYRKATPQARARAAALALAGRRVLSLEAHRERAENGET